jgi:hypothetical protein
MSWARRWQHGSTTGTWGRMGGWKFTAEDARIKLKRLYSKIVDKEGFRRNDLLVNFRYA